MCYSAFLMCAPVMICDAPLRRRAHTYPQRVFFFLWLGAGGRSGRLHLSAWQLTVNMQLPFSKPLREAGIRRACHCLRAAGRTQSELRDGRGWEWRQTTHHLIMLECATTLCIFSAALVIGAVFVQTVHTEKGLHGGRLGTVHSWTEKKDLFCGGRG